MLLPRVFEGFLERWYGIMIPGRTHACHGREFAIAREARKEEIDAIATYLLSIARSCSGGPPCPAGICLAPSLYPARAPGAAARSLRGLQAIGECAHSPTSFLVQPD